MHRSRSWQAQPEYLGPMSLVHGDHPPRVHTRSVPSAMMVLAVLPWSDVDRVPDLAMLVRRPAWQAQAACRGEPSSTFFLERGGSTRRAHELCDSCPVATECFAYAMADEELGGIWARTSDRQRGRLRHQTG